MPGQRRKSGTWLLLFPMLGLACGAPEITSTPGTDGSSSVDGGSPMTGDTMDAPGCMLPAAPANLCSALPTGKVTPCSETDGQPSQNGYLEIDGAGAAPVYVCATSWSADPSVGYIFGMPATFLSDPQGCCGGTVAPAAAPMVPQSAVGSLGTPRIPSHVKPQEMLQSDGGPLRQNPFAITVTDAASGAAAVSAMTTWLSYADAKPHPAPDGTGAYYFASGFPINYVVLETSDGFPAIVIGPEVELTADGTTPIGHPSLGVCPAGGGAPLVMTAGEVHGTTINNHSGRFDYGPGATAQALDAAAKVFNCFGIQITKTQYEAPKS